MVTMIINEWIYDAWTPWRPTGLLSRLTRTWSIPDQTMTFIECRVGYLFDEKMYFGPMIPEIAKKARCRVAALRRIKHLLDAENLKLLYTMFVRSTVEYGCVAFMGAAKSHLEKL